MTIDPYVIVGGLRNPETSTGGADVSQYEARVLRPTRWGVARELYATTDYLNIPDCCFGAYIHVGTHSGK
jgi:hypothetical protein